MHWQILRFLTKYAGLNVGAGKVGEYSQFNLLSTFKIGVYI